MPTDYSPLDAIHRAEQIAKAMWMPAIASAGYPNLTVRHVAVLAAIRDAGRAVTQSAIVAETHVDRSTLTEIMRKLSGLGLVTRQRKEADGRAYDIALTPDGRKALKDALRVRAQVETSLRSWVSCLDQIRFTPAEPEAKAA